LAIVMHQELGLGPWWRRGAVILLAGGIVASGGQGPLLALVLVLLAHWMRPVAALAIGVVANLIGVLVLPSNLVGAARGPLDVGRRRCSRCPGVGVGQSEFRTALATASRASSPASTSRSTRTTASCRSGSPAGLGAWIAWAALLLSMWERTGRAGRVAIAAVVVGGLTQDTLGDLEVIRALTAWVIGTSMLAGVSEEPSEGSS
jgi:hypothetical protein